MAATAYFAIPKSLFTDERYTGLSIEAKTLYGFMRDRFKLSLKNGREWMDTAGTFILMARQAMADFLKKSLPTVRKIIAELIGVGLLKERRMGLTKCNRLYVQLLPGERVEDLQPAEKPGFSPEGKPLAPSNHNPYDTYTRGYGQPAGKGKNKVEWHGQNGSKHPKGTVLAQNYTQRSYTREELDALFEVI